ncbi:MAG: hypothetical protein AAF743_15950 [Planctomycetota bacterium]
MTVSPAAGVQAYAAYPRESRSSVPTQTVAQMNAKFEAAAKDVSKFLASDQGKALGEFPRLQAHLGARLDVTA